MLFQREKTKRKAIFYNNIFIFNFKLSSNRSFFKSKVSNVSADVVIFHFFKLIANKLSKNANLNKEERKKFRYRDSSDDA